MKIHQPHDKLFKKMLGLKEVAIPFLKAYLSSETLQKLDLSTLALQKDSFLDSKFNAYYSDVIHKVDGANGDGYLYFLLEHQSTSDPFIVEKLLRYIANIVNYDMTRQLAIDPDRSKLKVPAIHLFVLYSGKEKYKWPKQSTLDGEGIDLLNLSSSLIELRKYTLEELLKSKKAALGQFLLKESWKKDFCKVIKDNPQLGELINRSPYAEEAILYMVDQDPHKEKVVEAIQNLDQKIKQKVMGNLMKIEQRGEQKGIKIGEQRGFREAIMRLLDHGMDKAKAAELLGLTPKKLKHFLAH